MKKILFAITFSIFFFCSLSAQEKKHEISVGVGIFSTNQIVSTLSDIIVNALPFNMKKENNKSIGALHAKYRYSITERIGVGGVFAFDYETSDAVQNNINVGKFRSSYYTIAIEGDFKYINSEKFKFYSLLGVGGTLLNQVYKDNLSVPDKNDNKIFFNFQITPIGLKFGNTFGGFTELGFGYKGILCVGLFYRL